MTFVIVIVVCVVVAGVGYGVYSRFFKKDEEDSNPTPEA